MLFITLLTKPYVGWLFTGWIHNLRHCSLDQFIQDFIWKTTLSSNAIFHTETFDATNSETSGVRLSFF